MLKTRFVRPKDLNDVVQLLGKEKDDVVKAIVEPRNRCVIAEGEEGLQGLLLTSIDDNSLSIKELRINSKHEDKNSVRRLLLERAEAQAFKLGVGLRSIVNEQNAEEIDFFRQLGWTAKLEAKAFGESDGIIFQATTLTP